QNLSTRSKLHSIDGRGQTSAAATILPLPGFKIDIRTLHFKPGPLLALGQERFYSSTNRNAGSPQRQRNSTRQQEGDIALWNPIPPMNKPDSTCKSTRNVASPGFARR